MQTAANDITDPRWRLPVDDLFFDSNSVLRFFTLYIFHLLRLPLYFLSSEGIFILKTTRVKEWADMVSGNRGKDI